MTPLPTTPIEPAGAYRTLEAGSLRGPVTPAPGRAPLSIAAAMARGLGPGWTMPEVIARCEAVKRRR